MDKKYEESISVLLATTLVFIISQSFFITYSTYMLAFLVIFSTIYISVKKKSKSGSQLFTSSPIEIFGIVSIILLILVLTGNLASPFFFLIYFVLFWLSFMSKKITLWVFSLSIFIFFVHESVQNPSLNTFIKPLSIIIIAPMAFFVAREFERRQRFNDNLEAKTKEIIQEAQTLKETTSSSSPDQIDAIDEIIEEAESIRRDKDA